jgi:cupin fold WbuC family metalloprotein
MAHGPGTVELIGDDLIAEVLEKAKRSSRQRMNHNFHSGAQDNPHRFLNIFIEGTYVAPHRHQNPPKTESFVVLEGFVTVICFEDDGTVRSRHVLGQGPGADTLPPAFRGLPVSRGIDVAPGIWHTIAAISPYAVCFEVKPGPWDPATDKEPAPWAPAEGDPKAPEYLAQLLS